MFIFNAFCYVRILRQKKPVLPAAVASTGGSD
jgi:hypothetical protein